MKRFREMADVETKGEEKFVNFEKATTYGTKYWRMDQVKFVEDSF